MVKNVAWTVMDVLLNNRRRENLNTKKELIAAHLVFFFEKKLLWLSNQNISTLSFHHNKFITFGLFFSIFFVLLNLFSLFTSIINCGGVWHKGYCPRKWTQQAKFKSWTKLFVFHLALMPLGKVWIPSPIYLWVTVSGQTMFFSLNIETNLERKIWISVTQLKNRPCFAPCLCWRG